MIGFEIPYYYGKIACFTINDTPGGQYVYANRNLPWIKQFLSNLSNGRCYLVTGCSGSPEHIDDTSFEGLQKWWDDKKIFPHDAGAYLTFFHDRRVYFLLHGSDYRPQRAWKANPLGLVFGGRIPYKKKRQRKLELRELSRTTRLSWKRDNTLSPFIPRYIHGFSDYEPAPQNQVGLGWSHG